MNRLVQLFPNREEFFAALAVVGAALLLYFACGIAEAWGLILFASPLLAARLFADFMHWHRGRSQPDEGRIVAIQSVIGLLMIWIPFIFVDNNAYEILKKTSDGGLFRHEYVEWPLNLLVAPQEEINGISHPNVQTVKQASQGISLSCLIARTFVFFIPSLWTMMIVEHFLVRTCHATRGNRFAAQVAVGTLLHFGFAWRWIPNEVMFDSDLDFTWKWFLGCLVVCSILAPVTPDSEFRPKPI